MLSYFKEILQTTRNDMYRVSYIISFKEISHNHVIVGNSCTARNILGQTLILFAQKYIKRGTFGGISLKHVLGLHELSMGGYDYCVVVRGENKI